MTQTERSRRWRKLNLDKSREYGRQWIKEYRAKNPEQSRECRRKWYQKNILKAREYARLWAQRNRKEITKKYREQKRVYSQLPHVRLRRVLSKRIQHAINRKVYSVKTMELLGCSLADLVIYLESKFEPGMSWENYGKLWEIDHIMPCAIFDLSKPEHRKRCFHFSNLQPLLAFDNRSKGAKLTTNQYNLL